MKRSNRLDLDRPGTQEGKTRAQETVVVANALARRRGFTLVEIMIVVAIIGLLASIALPNWVHARTNSQISACINNLRQVDAAKQQWALEAKKAGAITPDYSDIMPYLKSSVTCPNGGSVGTFDSTYNMGDLTVKPTCKIEPQKHALPLEVTN